MFINNEDTFMGQFLLKMGIQPEVHKKSKSTHVLVNARVVLIYI